MAAPISRRSFLSTTAVATACGLGAKAVFACPTGVAGPTVEDTFALRRAGKKIPVIFDTDIGNDIDDTWALLMLLNSPELDVKLVASDHTNCTYRAKILAKMLEVCKRTDVPVGVGLKKGDERAAQSDWVVDYDLDSYAGEVYEDGVDAIIRTIRQSKDPITLIAVGPVTNLPEVLRRAPDVAEKARFVGMHGSVRKGYANSPKISPEWNVRADPPALQAVFAAPWEKTVTPLDTCGIVHLKDDRYAKVLGCQAPGTKALIENYRIWTKWHEAQDRKMPDPSQRSSTLYDTVAIYLGYSEDLVEMETHPLIVTDDGYTRIDAKGHPARCAMAWKDLGGFEQHLTERVTREG